MNEECSMDQFVIDLSDAVELPTVESPWYVIAGSSVCLIVREHLEG